MFCVGFADIFTPKNINNVLVNTSELCGFISFCWQGQLLHCLVKLFVLSR